MKNAIIPATLLTRSNKIVGTLLVFMITVIHVKWINRRLLSIILSMLKYLLFPFKILFNHSNKDNDNDKANHDDYGAVSNDEDDNNKGDNDEDDNEFDGVIDHNYGDYNNDNDGYNDYDNDEYNENYNNDYDVDVIDDNEYFPI